MVVELWGVKVVFHAYRRNVRSAGHHRVGHPIAGERDEKNRSKLIVALLYVIFISHRLHNSCNQHARYLAKYPRTNRDRHSMSEALELGP
jgi:hypothetical protein